MAAKLTTEGLVERLPLINAKAVCEKAEVDYNRFKGWKLGRVRTLDEDEMKRLAIVLNSLSVYCGG